ncbi:polysaccharide deacetylase family protein [Plebeiibacterium sediminum]|uniref:Polysaccharide deacetylase family protein n=1 Tax=Plebeiibacterium sediminum TaxID=2992112 RepID=A0AAE3M744_9BACT|nr:polysaccharide deacetylase family protein [Plebeiobacterium sediminum]MCW3787795.1 polysaccharide deacetylase family protein [Plebeiobacterium sediminum]
MIRFGKSYWISLLVIIFSQACDGQVTKVSDYHFTADFNAVGLVYHRFGDNRYPTTNTTKQLFEQQLKYLNDNHIKTFTINQLSLNQDSGNQKVFITVDDGFVSFYKNGFPLLKKYNCKATIFINTESVGWSDYMNWEQIKELVKAGIQIGSHSHAHSYFLNISKEERIQAFIEDLEKSEQLFLEHLGFVPKVYAYPYGEFDNTMERVLKERGYNLAFAQNSGVWDCNSNLYAIPRFPASGAHFGMDKFTQRIAMKSLPIQTNEPGPIVLSAQQKYSIELRLDDSNNFSSLNCFFNNQYEPKLFTIKDGVINVNITMPANKRRALLTFTSKSKNGDWYWWSMLFINPKYLN